MSTPGDGNASRAGNEERNGQARGGRQRRGLAFALVSVGLIAVAALAIIYFRTSSTAPLDWGEPAPGGDRWTRSVVLYYGSPMRPELVAEERELLMEVEEEANVSRLVAELLRGSSADNVSLLDPDARVRSVYLSDSGDVVLDFQRSPFPPAAGTSACRLGLQSIIRVLRERFPDLRTLTLLVDGEPLSTREGRLHVPDRLVLAPSRGQSG